MNAVNTHTRFRNLSLYPWGMALIVFLGLILVMFAHYASSTHVLLTTDSVISGAGRFGVEALRLAVPNWRDQQLMGLPAGGAAQVPNLLKGFMPGVLWNNWSYVLGCLLTSLALFAYVRKFVNLVWAGIFAGLVGVWLGSNFTLLYAGHFAKPYVVLFFVCSLLPAGRAAAGSVAAALVWGGCVGLMFVQQADLALFCALFAGAYLVFRLWQEQGKRLQPWFKALLPAAAVAFLFAGGPLLSGYRHQVKGTVQMESQSPEEKWNFSTQWSFPPEEMTALIAMGYTGWRSGEPEGPYWGRMGRSAGWEQTGQGFQNFKLENTYLGVIPFAFALFGLFSCGRSRHRAEILFWGCGTVLALLLAFGKYFPLYALLYKLPVVSSIRNPNKFLQVFQVALAISAAYGVDALFGQRSKVKGQEPGRTGIRPFFWMLLGALAMVGLWALSLTLGRAEDVGRFLAQGWPQEAAAVIVQNRIAAVRHAWLMVAVVGGVFAVFTFPQAAAVRRFRGWIAAGLVLLVAADAARLSKHYVKEMPRSYIEANALTRFLQTDLGHERVALLSQQGIYNVWISYLLPYHKIATFNVAQMSRIPQDYQQLMAAGSKNPLEMWRFAGVKYLLAPTSVEQQISPGQLRKVFAYDLAAGVGTEFQVVAAPGGAHAVFEFVRPIPRYSLVPPAEAEPAEQVLARIVDPRLPLPGEPSSPGSVAVERYRPGRVELAVQAEDACTLRAAERWDADWKATVDGEPVDVQRIDFLCQGVTVPPGAHQVVLTYAPSRLLFYMQCGGFLILVGALVASGRRSPREA